MRLFRSCRRVQAQYKELSLRNDRRSALSRAAHALDLQRAVAVRSSLSHVAPAVAVQRSIGSLECSAALLGVAFFRFPVSDELH